MYYVIRIITDSENKYIFNGNLLVRDITCARKFYSSAYAKRYVRTHERYNGCKFELIRMS